MFYDEREWRYIPSITKNIHLEILKEKNDEDRIKNEMNQLTATHKLKVNPEDITYIIVQEQSENREVVKFLEKTYPYYGYLELLYSEIVTVKQIKEDF